MTVLLVLTAVVLFAVVLAIVVLPVVRPKPELEVPDVAVLLADLEQRKQLKYREIRDAEMDYRSGKLSHEDFERVDRELRSEAIEILREIDAAEGKTAD